MAQAIAGKTGKILVTGTPDTQVALITEWNVDIERDAYDSTALGDDWETSVIGMGKWSGRCSGYFSVETDGGQTLLHNAILAGTSLTLEMHADNSATVYVGKVNPGKCSIGNPVNGLASIEFDFKGTGQLLFS